MAFDQTTELIAYTVAGSGAGALALRGLVRRLSADLPEVKSDLASAKMLDRLQGEIARLEDMIDRMQSRVELLETKIATLNFRVGRIRIEALDAYASVCRMDECVCADHTERGFIKDALKRIIVETEI